MINQIINQMINQLGGGGALPKTFGERAALPPFTDSFQVVSFSA